MQGCPWGCGCCLRPVLTRSRVIYFAVPCPEAVSYTHLDVYKRQVLAGVICIADPLRPEAAQVLRQLQKLGITQTVMMTGDSDRTARAIAAQVGVDRCFRCV